MQEHRVGKPTEYRQQDCTMQSQSIPGEQIAPKGTSAAASPSKGAGKFSSLFHYHHILIISAQ